MMRLYFLICIFSDAGMPGANDIVRRLSKHQLGKAGKYIELIPIDGNRSSLISCGLQLLSSIMPSHITLIDSI
jgi:hypothetical protein